MKKTKDKRVLDVDMKINLKDWFEFATRPLRTVLIPVPGMPGVFGAKAKPSRKKNTK
jgi:hypothetical protein